MLALPLGVWALEVYDAVFVEAPEARGYFVDEVVSNSYDGASVTVKSCSMVTLIC
jgi:hypothetical protein